MSKKTAPQAFYSEEQAQLPPNFAQSVLDLEMKLDSEESDLNTIKQLNELYRMAVEYYINVDAKKANHFQKKLTNLLTNPITLQLIEPKQKAKANFNKANVLSQNVKEEVGKFNSQANSYVKNIIENTERKLEKSESLIRLSLNSQQDKLKERLMQRSQSRKYL